MCTLKMPITATGFPHKAEPMLSLSYQIRMMITTSSQAAPYESTKGNPSSENHDPHAHHTEQKGARTSHKHKGHDRLPGVYDYLAAGTQDKKKTLKSTTIHPLGQNKVTLNFCRLGGLENVRT